MLACARCRFENSEASSFCGGCGERLEQTRTCPACQESSPAGYHFCGACGASLTSTSALERDPREYTPRHLAERILDSKSALEGERKRVTVLFADVRDSTAMASAIDPEAWHVILNRFFEILTEGIHRFDGTVNQYTGDGIMALFGAPIAHEDHAQRACWAALDLQQRLRDYGDELRREGTNLSVRLGLNSGEVVVGKIGDDLRMDYTAQGSTVALAQRAESLAEAGRVLLTSNTHELVSGYFAVRSLGETQLQGVPEPIELFELEGTGPLRTRLDASRAAGFTRFVGRATEVAQLNAALDHALSGAGTVVGVVGEAGVGKSRLCETFAEHARARGVRVYETHSPSHAKSLSGVAARELVRSFFGVEERDTPEEARRKIAGTLVLLDDSLREALPLVFDVAGVVDPEHPLPPMDPVSRRQMAVRFLRELMRARSEREAAIFLFDDLHWIDPESDEFLADVVAASHGTRTLVLANFRTEYQADWMSGSRYQQIPLRPFGRAESEALLDELLGRDPTLEPVRSLVLNQAGGNPFFTEELARALVESGAVEGPRGERRLVAEPQTIVIPETVHGVLAGRIDRLPEREKHLLQTASVIGRDFAEPVLEAVAELSAEEIAEAIDSLTRAEFVHETQLFPQAEYRFKHALTQDVAYESQLRERRRVVHGRTARALEALETEPRSAGAGEIAQHFELAVELDHAASWFTRAAERTSSVISVAAGQYWRKVLETTRDTADEEIRDLRLRAFVHTILGSWGEWEVGDAEALYEEGLALAERAGDSNSQILIESAYALLVLGRDEGQRAQFAHLERAISLVGSDTPLSFRISLHQRLSWSHSCFGNAVAAGMHAERGLELASFDAASDAKLLGYNAVGAMLAARALALTSTGQLDEAREALGQASQAATSHGDPLSENLTEMARSFLHQVNCNWPEALTAAQAGIVAMSALDSLAWQAPVKLQLLDIHADRDAWQDVLRVYEGLESEAIGRDSMATMATLYQAVARMEIKADDAARTVANAARLGSEAVIGTTMVCETRLLWAQLVRLLDGAMGAEAASVNLDVAMQDAEQRSLRAFMPRIHAERAALAMTCGDEDGRKRSLTQAIAISREIGAPRRAERYQSALDGEQL